LIDVGGRQSVSPTAVKRVRRCMQPTRTCYHRPSRDSLRIRTTQPATLCR